MLEKLIWDDGKYFREDGEPVKEKSIGEPETVIVLDKDLSSLEREKKAISAWWELFKRNGKDYLEDVNAYCRGGICMLDHEKRSCSITFYKI